MHPRSSISVSDCSAPGSGADSYSGPPPIPFLTVGVQKPIADLRPNPDSKGGDNVGQSPGTAADACVGLRVECVSRPGQGGPC